VSTPQPRFDDGGRGSPETEASTSTRSDRQAGGTSTDDDRRDAWLAREAANVLAGFEGSRTVDPTVVGRARRLHEAGHSERALTLVLGAAFDGGAPPGDRIASD
jgi:hypothetical protein